MNMMNRISRGSRGIFKRSRLSRCFSVQPRRVQSAACHDVTDADLAQIALHSAEPFHLKGGAKLPVDLLPLLQATNRLVEIEHGRYDQPKFDKVTLPLAVFANCLEQGETQLDGKPLYLAQVSLWEDVPSLKAHIKQPAFLAALFTEGSADLYQAQSFIGVCCCSYGRL
jgi:hypothetical protein